MWKGWRNSTKEKDKTLAEDEEVDLPGEEERDSPGQGNILHRSKKFPEKLGGEQLEWRGAYQEISGEESTAKSTAPCEAGPLDRQGVTLEEEDQLDKDEMMRMEILLGMEQEEGTPCLLCLLPRCICHVTMDLLKLELKLKQLEAKHEVDGQGEVKDSDDENPDINDTSDTKGDSSGLLEGEGLTSKKEGSLPPRRNWKWKRNSPLPPKMTHQQSRLKWQLKLKLRKEQIP